MLRGFPEILLKYGRSLCTKSNSSENVKLYHCLAVQYWASYLNSLIFHDLISKRKTKILYSLTVVR